MLIAPQSPDTIAAISTPPGRGGIGIVRLSGPDALGIAGQLIQLGIPLEHGHARRARVLDPTDSTHTIDDALITAFLAPNSYTGENVAEIAAHGSPVILDALLRNALRHGARTEELMRARARVAQAQAQLALQRELLARHVLHAEGAGEVVDVAIKVGELAATGTPAVTLADTTHPYVDVFVPQGELEGIHAGVPVDVRVDATTAPFGAVVESVSPDTEFTPKFLFSDRERPHLVIRVRVRVKDPQRRLHSGVPAFAQVHR